MLQDTPWATWENDRAMARRNIGQTKTPDLATMESFLVVASEPLQ